MADGFVQVQPDSIGKRVGNVAVILPGGTLVADADGVETLLADDTTVFLQRVVISDEDGKPVKFEDSTVHQLLWQILGELQLMNERAQN